nr:hypothetical protein [Nitrosospira multiformis]
MECVWQQDYADHAELNAILPIHHQLLQRYSAVLELGYLFPTAYERIMTATPPISLSEIT